MGWIELAHFAVILALALAVVQAFFPLLGASRSDQRLMSVAGPAALGQFIFVLFSFLVLMRAYILSDFSVINVAENSHSLKPMLYKISGVWGNHEGSILLWALILALFGALVAVFGRYLPMSLRARVLAVQAMIGIGFYLFMLLTSNPFERTFPYPEEGNGLNPLLQDPGLAFHPPFLYLGYVGLSVTFSFAVAALMEGKIDPAWARWVRPWTLVAWVFLTIGIVLGSWWAYYELGWGGWWFWDPVENASFMPWLVATALLHSAIVVEKRDTLKSWTVLLAIIAFSFSLLGTFLVRSGVLISVHAFATDPDRGIFILLFLCLVVGGSLLLYALRADKLQPGGLFQPISRESALVMNNLLLSVSAATVLFGTLYPMFAKMAGVDLTVGPPFFEITFGTLMIPLVLIMAVGPMLTWKRADLQGISQRLMILLVVSAVVAVITLVLDQGSRILPALWMGLGIWLLLATLDDLAYRIRLFKGGGVLKRLSRQTRASWGMTLGHLGLAVMILGMTGTSSWNKEIQQLIPPGTNIEAGTYQITFEKATPVVGPNYTALEGRFQVYQDGEFIKTLTPQTRTFTQPLMTTTEAAIHTTFTEDLFIVLGEGDIDATGAESWAVRIYIKPLQVWIWLGATIMVIGGIISLSDRRLRVGAARKKKSQSTGGTPHAA